jgi:hypothetical protein
MTTEPVEQTELKNILLAEAKHYLEYGKKVVTVKITEDGAKKPTLEKWTPLRNVGIDIEQVERWLSNPEAKYIAILLDKAHLALDYDRSGEYVVWDKLVPRCSPKLQEAFHKTTFTKSPEGGHLLFGMNPEEFSDNIKDSDKGFGEIQYWSNGEEHNEVVLLSPTKYLVERGIGYLGVRGIESLVTLDKPTVLEFVDLLKRGSREDSAVKKSVDALLKYYYNSNRDRLTFALSGVLHKGGLEDYLIGDLQEYLMDVAGIDTAEERQQRFNVIKSTCAKDRNSGEVSGRDKFLEAVNNDETVLVTIQGAFKPLGYFKGYHYANNETATATDTKKTKAKAKEKSKDEEEPEEPEHRYEYLQFYVDDNRFAEAVTIGKSQRFAVVDNNTKEISLEQKIVTDLEWDELGQVTKQMVYMPTEELSYMNKPYLFRTDTEFFDMVDFVKNPQMCTLDGIYQTVKRVWSEYLDVEESHLIVCAADTIFSYLQDILGLTHYLWFVGDNESGKSNNLVVFHYLGYRNMMSIGISVANIYQFLGSGAEGIGTICEDEANQFDEDKDKMELAKSGYTKGFPVIRITTLGNGQRRQIRYNTFCIKLYSAESMPDPVKAKGLLHRVIKLRCVAGDP